jgi:cytochrome c-type biogenesis protein CcmH/NrfF
VKHVAASFWLFLGALIVVVTVVLVAAPSTPTSSQRIAHLESIVKCPACQDISVAESNAPSSVALRHQIVAAVNTGANDNQVIAAIESRYGNNILLSPRGSGLDSLLWIVPIIVVVGGLATYARVLRRRP